MKKIKYNEMAQDIPEDFDYTKQELHISIKAKPVGTEEDDNIETDISCKMHGTNNFAKAAIYSFLKDDGVMFQLFKEVIVDIMLNDMISDKNPMFMGKGGDA